MTAIEQTLNASPRPLTLDLPYATYEPDAIADVIDAVKDYPRWFYGNKWRMLDHILRVIPKGARRIVDLFAGTAVCGNAIKRLTSAAIDSNEISFYGYLRAACLVANNNTFLTGRDLRTLTRRNLRRQSWFWDKYRHILGEKNAAWLDNFSSNIPKLRDPRKRSLAVLIALLCINSHLKFAAINFTPCGDLTGNQNHRLQNADLEADIVAFAQRRLPSLLFDNGQLNEAYREDAVTMISKFRGQVAYVDSPYVCRVNYRDLYAWPENLVLCITGRGDEVRNRFRLNERPSYTRFGRLSSVRMSFHRLFLNSRQIPVVIVSYNTTSRFAISEIETIARTHGRTVMTQYIPYPRPTTIKGRNTRTEEVLLVCLSERRLPKEWL